MGAAVQAMIGASRHRGPDAEGMTEIAAGAATLLLGHTRLSILDLSEGSRQPIEHVETGSWLVYNGEIYNFRELRRELEGQGVKFRTTGDTEVLLEALVVWGEAALGKLEGMFAFGFWDGLSKMLLLARDAMGIKPLYYRGRNGWKGAAGSCTFAFASEVKVLERAGVGPLTVDEEGVDSFLAYGAVTGPNTIWKEIKELEPGRLLRVNARGEIATAEWWSLKGVLANRAAGEVFDFEQAVSLVRKRLEHAVGSHLVSDVPVGVFLSGGVDSSLLALAASQYATSPVTLLTVAFPEEEFSELPHAQQVACKTRCRHEVVTLSAERLRELLPGALATMDQPTLDGINTYVISRAGAECGLKVLLTGVGGDEIFGGYSTFSKVPRLWKYGAKYGAGLRPAARVLSRLGTKNAIPWKKIADAGEMQSLAEVYLLQRSVRWAGKRRRALARTLQNRIDTLANEFQKVAALELEFYMRYQLLRDADVFSMANSVELRVPFLDLALVETAVSLDPEYHFEGARGKRLTRQIMSDLMGEVIPQRPKMGFTFPWRQWLRDTLRETIAGTLREERLYGSFDLDPAYGRQLLDGLEGDDRLQSWSEVWTLFVLLNWQGRTGVKRAAA